MRAPTPLLFLLAAAALAPPALGQDIRPGGPTHAGTRAVCDLPTGQHLRNTGGSDGPGGPGTGSGLCVPTSCEIVSRWQSAALAGLQAWCQKRPGGSYPEKLEQYIVQFCREQRRDIPPYVQHTGGDETLLDLAIRTGRMPAITYAGVDDFYREVIAHMVCLAHLDPPDKPDPKAAIIDNNRPGQWVWMTRRQLLNRWRGVDANGRPLTVPTIRGPMQVGGGWCVIFLDGPPPPYSTKPAEERAAAERVQYGQWCPPGVRSWGSGPAAGPVAQPVVSVFPDEYNRAAEAVRAGERIVLVVGTPPSWFRDGSAGVHRSPSFSGVADGVYECWPLDGVPSMERLTDAGQVAAAMLKVGQVVGQKAEPKAEARPAETNFGVDLDKMQGGKRWFHNGAETSKEDVLAAVAGGNLVDDSDKWFLCFVGTPAEQAAFAAAAKQLEPTAAAKLHVKAYSSADWQVTQFGLPPGVSIRKAARGRVGEEAGRLAGEVSGDNLQRFVADSFSPPKPMPPAPPAPGPQPDPTPAPEPAPPSTPFGIPMWLLAAVAVAVTYLLTRRK